MRHGATARSLLALALVVVLSACSSPASSTGPSGPLDTSPPTGESPLASAAANATEGPSGSVVPPVLPTGEPVGPEWTPRPLESLLVNAAVTVLVDRLNMREEPTVAAKGIGVVEVGDFLLVDGYGPFVGDGYTWYHAVFIGKAGEPPAPGVDLAHSDGMRGWIAAAKGTAAYVRQLLPRCPSTIDLTTVQNMLGAELLACFGSNSIEVTGTFGCSGCGGAAVGEFEPGWLAYPFNANFITPYPVGDNLGPFAVRFAPDGPADPAPGSVVRARGHFDDAAAATCHISIIDPLKPDGEHFVTISSDAARLVCAQQFVVETVDVLGTDPGFVFG